MSDSTPPPAPKDSPARAGLAAADLGLDPWAASDPDKTPPNAYLVQAPISEGMLSALRELTPVTVPIAAKPEPFEPPGAPAVPRPPGRPPAVVQQPVVVQHVVPAQPSFAVPRQELTAGRPLIERAGIEAPSIKDPHAAFRKGNTMKRLLLVAVLGGLLAALFFLMPQKETAENTSLKASDSRDNAVIGSSLSPNVIPDPNNRSDAEPPQTAPAAQETTPSSAPNSADNAGFSAAFKSHAK